MCARCQAVRCCMPVRECRQVDWLASAQASVRAAAHPVLRWEYHGGQAGVHCNAALSQLAPRDNSRAG